MVRSLALAILVVASCTTIEEDTDVPPTRSLYVIAGQSNALGGAGTAALSAANAFYAVADPRVLVQRQLDCATPLPAACTLNGAWGAMRPHTPPGGGAEDRLGVELSLAKRLLDRHAPGTVYVLHNATSGTGLVDDWNPDATSGMQLYARMRSLINAQRTALNAQLRGIYWIQGNADASSLANAQAYASRLAAFIARCRADFNEPNLAFVFDQLTPLSGSVFKAELRASQAWVAANVPNVRMIPTEGLELRDGDTHYTADAFIELGLDGGDAFNEFWLPVQPAGGNQMRVHKSDGTEVTVAADGSMTLLANTTYYLTHGIDAASRGSIQLTWDNAIVITSAGPVQDANLPAVSPVETIVGKWVDEDPSTAFASADGTGATFTPATGKFAVAGGNVGGCMLHFADFGSRRVRLPIVVGATGGVIFAAVHTK